MLGYPVDLSNGKVVGNTKISYCQFLANADFVSTMFGRTANLSDVDFNGITHFSSAIFYDTTNFTHVNFDLAFFDGVNFGKQISFFEDTIRDIGEFFSASFQKKLISNIAISMANVHLIKQFFMVTSRSEVRISFAR